jgi:hypothetical protein
MSVEEHARARHRTLPVCGHRPPGGTCPSSLSPWLREVRWSPTNLVLCQTQLPPLQQELDQLQAPTRNTVHTSPLIHAHSRQAKPPADLKIDKVTTNASLPTGMSHAHVRSWKMWTPVSNRKIRTWMDRIHYKEPYVRSVRTRLLLYDGK